MVWRIVYRTAALSSFAALSKALDGTPCRRMLDPAELKLDVKPVPLYIFHGWTRKGSNVFNRWLPGESTVQGIHVPIELL